MTIEELADEFGYDRLHTTYSINSFVLPLLEKDPLRHILHEKSWDTNLQFVAVPSETDTRTMGKIQSEEFRYSLSRQDASVSIAFTIASIFEI